jgi:hypothetical protein
MSNIHDNDIKRTIILVIIFDFCIFFKIKIGFLKIGSVHEEEETTQFYPTTEQREGTRRCFHFRSCISFISGLAFLVLHFRF